MTKKTTNKLIYIFDYDDTLKSEFGICPDKNSFINLVKTIKERTGMPMVILTSGFARFYDSIYTTIDRIMRPIDYIHLIGLTYKENDFDTNVDVCVFDAKHKHQDLQKQYGHPLIDRNGRKNLSSLNFIIYLKYGFSLDMILFDDLNIHSINAKQPKIGLQDPFSYSKVLYIQVRKLGKSEKESCERINIYTKIVDTSSIDRKSGVFTIAKYRGSELLLKII